MLIPLALSVLITLVPSTVHGAEFALTARAECKKCPDPLCSNKRIYDPFIFGARSVRPACRIDSVPIEGYAVWLQSEEKCFLPAAYVEEANFDSLPVCPNKPPPPREFNTRLRFYSECTICPYQRCDAAHFYHPGDNTRVVCWSNVPSHSVINNTIWFKTEKNCYLPEIALEEPPKQVSEQCGPIPFLSLPSTAHLRQNSRPSMIKRSYDVARSAHTLIRDTVVDRVKALAKRAPQFLISVITTSNHPTSCRTCASKDCAASQTYSASSEVILQCFGTNATDLSANDFYPANSWGLTTQFCWVNMGNLVYEKLDLFRFPTCDKFSIPDVS